MLKLIKRINRKQNVVNEIDWSDLELAGEEPKYIFQDTRQPLPPVAPAESTPEPVMDTIRARSTSSAPVITNFRGSIKGSHQSPHLINLKDRQPTQPATDLRSINRQDATAIEEEVDETFLLEQASSVITPHRLDGLS